MSEVLLFHHSLGCTPGVLSVGDRIRRARHQVHVPDLYEGKVFKHLDEGIHHAQSVGFDALLQRAKSFAEPLPRRIVDAGTSLGVMPAQL
jgi:hypothetical protein